MKYCSKCGNQLLDEAVICTKCGCAVEAINIFPKPKIAKLEGRGVNMSWTPLMFGIIAFFNSIWTLLVRFANLKFAAIMNQIVSFMGLGCCGILAVVTGIKYLKSKQKGFAIAGLILGGLALFTSFIFGLVYGIKYYSFW